MFVRCTTDKINARTKILPRSIREFPYHFLFFLVFPPCPKCSGKEHYHAPCYHTEEDKSQFTFRLILGHLQNHPRGQICCDVHDEVICSVVRSGTTIQKLVLHTQIITKNQQPDCIAVAFDRNTVEPPVATTSRKRPVYQTTSLPNYQKFPSQSLYLEPLVSEHHS